MKQRDIRPGMRLGRWTVQERVPLTPGRSFWRCRCDCGTVDSVDAYSLARGTSKSCGCLRAHTTSVDGLTKYCSGCGLHVLIADFASHERRGKVVPRSLCRSCTTKRNKSRGAYYRVYQAKCYYGISADRLAALYTRAGSACEICRKPEAVEREVAGYLCIDHCHSTKFVRGLLCRSCNSALGLFGDDRAMMQRAIEYLEERQP